MTKPSNTPPVRRRGATLGLVRLIAGAALLIAGFIVGSIWIRQFDTGSNGDTVLLVVALAAIIAGAVLATWGYRRSPWRH